MTTVRDELRARAADVLRAAAHERRLAARALATAGEEVTSLALAAVESLETLTDTLEALAPQLPDALRPALAVTVRASWERLETAGLQRDGAVGEDLDLSRHRVVKARGTGRREVVADVLAPGVTFKGRRVREAAVTVSGEEVGDGSRRD